MKEGKDLTIVTSLDMAIEALKIAEKLKPQNVDIEIIDLCSVKPLDEKTILESVRKTGRLLAIDSSWKDFGVASQVSALVAEKGYNNLKSPIRRIGLPDIPSPSTPALSKEFYPRAKDICKVIGNMLEMEIDMGVFEEEQLPHDVPDPFFKGPF